MRTVTSDDAFSKLLSKLPPEVAERVAAKYADDREEFITYLKSKTPSESPGYWALKGCTKCYSRGIVGINKATENSVICACVAKRYQAWVSHHRKAFNKRKEENASKPESGSEEVP